MSKVTTYIDLKVRRADVVITASCHHLFKGSAKKCVTHSKAASDYLHVKIQYLEKLILGAPLTSHEQKNPGTVVIIAFIFDPTGTTHQQHTERILNLLICLYRWTPLERMPSEVGKETDIIGLTSRYIF